MEIVIGPIKLDPLAWKCWGRTCIWNGWPADAPAVPTGSWRTYCKGAAVVATVVALGAEAAITVDPELAEDWAMAKPFPEEIVVKWTAVGWFCCTNVWHGMAELTDVAPARAADARATVTVCGWVEDPVTSLDKPETTIWPEFCPRDNEWVSFVFVRKLFLCEGFSDLIFDEFPLAFEAEVVCVGFNQKIVYHQGLYDSLKVVIDKNIILEI